MFILMSLALAGDEREVVQRPEALQAAEACTLWRGTASGNDPSTLLELELCGGARLTGRLQWSSTQSGHNLRTVEGVWSDDGVELWDTGMPVSEPAPGWYFCTIERYALHRAGPRVLTGTFEARTCNDTASVTLNLVEGELVRPDDAATVASRAPTPWSPSTGWGCATLPVLGGALWMLPILGVRPRSRRASGR